MTCIPGFQTVDNDELPIALCNVANRFVMPQPELVGRIREVPIAVPPEELFNAYPTLGRASKGDNWELLLETREGVVALNPVTMFWVDSEGGRSPQFSTNTPQLLYLEFLYEPSDSTTLQSAQLRLREAVDQNLVTTLRLREVLDLLVQINAWLQHYTAATDPLWISAGLLIRDPQEAPLSSASAQIEWIDALLEADRATQIPGFRQLAVLAAESLLNRFYGSIPTVPTEWLPQEFLLEVGSLAELEPVVDVLVTFVDGVGLLVDPAVETVHQVYEGVLRGRSPTSPLLSGQNFRIATWTDADSVERQAPANQRIETVPPPAPNVVLVDIRAAALGPVFTPFSLGVFY
ncbi:MAG: hypothetical protein SNJ57_10075 [Cyanobacteriota bacterium]